MEPSENFDPIEELDPSKRDIPSAGDLRVLVDPEGAVVDLVAIHGLGADPESTWVKYHPPGSRAAGTGSFGFKPGVMWLESVLPEFIPNTRILLFNYRSNPWINAMRWNLRALGGDLVRAVKNEQRRQVDPHRPIVFLAHSFGGLIVEEALTLAHAHADSKFRVIAEVTKGVLFLGSPLHGTRAVSWPSFIIRIASLAGIDSHADLFKAAGEDSEKTEELAAGFLAIVTERKMDVVCFYEGLKTPIIKARWFSNLIWLLEAVGLYWPARIISSWNKYMVVPKLNACLDGNNIQKIALDTDHSGLNKFGDSINGDFRKVKAQIVNIVNRPDEVLTQAQEDSLKELKNQRAHTATLPTKPTPGYPECLRGTRKSVLSAIKRWASSRENQKIFWLHGMAGTGKSAISRTIARYFKNQKELGSAFFFRKGDSVCGNTKKLAINLATDLMEVLPLKCSISEVVTNDSLIATKMFDEQFELLIHRPLAQVKGCKRNVVIVIDALDECEDQWVSIVIQRLAKLEAPNIQFRILITSRLEPRIKGGFSFLNHKEYAATALQRLQKRTIRRDIEIFYEDAFATIRKSHSQRGLLQPHWPGTENIKTLVEKDYPLFISAFTRCIYISAEEGSPDIRLKEALRSHTTRRTSLHEIYEQVLEKAVSNSGRDRRAILQDLKYVIGSIILLQYPLPHQSISELLYHNDKDSDRLLDILPSLHPVLEIPDFIKEPDRPIRTLHLSFSEFLLDSKGKHEFRIEPTQMHSFIAYQCLGLLEGVLKKDMCRLIDPAITIDKIDEGVVMQHLSFAIPYACRYWVYHLKSSGEKIIQDSRVHKFLQTFLLHWFEAASLMKFLPQIIGAILDLESIMEGNHMQKLLYDIRRFIQANLEMMSKAPLQIYTSALIFSPKNSIVRQIFEPKEGLKWISKAPGVEAEWDYLLQTLNGHSRGIKCLISFPTPQGTLLASGSFDNTIILWDCRTGALLRVLRGHTDVIECLAFCCSGTNQSSILASGSEDGTVKLWDAITGQILRTLTHINSESVLSLGYSPQTDYLIAASRRNITFWKLGTGKREKVFSDVFDGRDLRFLAVCPSFDRSTAASVCQRDGRIWLWDLANRSTKRLKLRPLPLPPNPCLNFPRYLAFSPRNPDIIAAAYSDSVIIWDVSTDTLIQELDNSSIEFEFVAFSADGATLIGADVHGNIQQWIVRERTVYDGQVFKAYSVSTWCFLLVGESNFLVALSDKSRIKFLDLRYYAPKISKNQYLEVDLLGSIKWRTKISPDGQKIAISGKNQAKMNVIAILGANDEYLTTFDEEVGEVFSFSPDSQILVTASSYGIVLRNTNFLQTEDIQNQQVQEHLDSSSFCVFFWTGFSLRRLVPYVRETFSNWQKESSKKRDLYRYWLVEKLSPEYTFREAFIPAAVAISQGAELLALASAFLDFGFLNVQVWNINAAFSEEGLAPVPSESRMQPLTTAEIAFNLMGWDGYVTKDDWDPLVLLFLNNKNILVIASLSSLILLDIEGGSTRVIMSVNGSELVPGLRPKFDIDDLECLTLSAYQLKNYIHTKDYIIRCSSLDNIQVTERQKQREDDYEISTSLSTEWITTRSGLRLLWIPLRNRHHRVGHGGRKLVFSDTKLDFITMEFDLSKYPGNLGAEG